MKRVLFIDARNSARSPMAVAWFKALCKNGDHASSCGTMPARQVDPTAVKVMREVGLNIRNHAPKAVNQQLVTDADVVVLLGSDVFPQAFSPRYIWKFQDPTGQSIENYRGLRDAIRDAVQALVKEIMEQDHQLSERQPQTIYND